MDEQSQVKGYRQLTPEQVAGMNEVKTLEQGVSYLVRDLLADPTASPEVKRWASIARTHLETGFMFLCKAVAQPDGGLGQL